MSEDTQSDEMEEEGEGGKKQSTHDLGPEPIENGIQLRVSGLDPHQTIAYACLPNAGISQALDWTPLTEEDMQVPHIRCHQLQQGDLPLEIAKLKSPNVQGLLLINTKDNYSIELTLLTSKEVPTLPILVVTSTSGKRILHILNQHPQCVEVKVDILASLRPDFPNGSANGATKDDEEVEQNGWLVVNVQHTSNGSCSKEALGNGHTAVEQIWEGSDIASGSCSEEVLGNGHTAVEQIQEGSDVASGDVKAHLQNSVIKDESTEGKKDIPKSDATEETIEADVANGKIIGTNQEGELQSGEGSSTVDTTEPPVKQQVIDTDASESSDSRSDPTKCEIAHSILNGLQLRIKSGRDLIHLSYAWAPVTENPQPIDWMEVVTREVTYPHIRCHQLTSEDEKIPWLINTLHEDEHAKGLILVNAENSYQIDPKLLESREKLPDFPVIVVPSHQGGETLLDMLTKHAKNVEAKIETEPMKAIAAMEVGKDLEEKPNPEPEQQPEPEPQEEPGFRFLGKTAQYFGFGKKQKPSIDLAGQVQHLLNQPDGTRIATEDEALFQLVMAHFHTFEKEGGGADLANRTLCMLEKQCQSYFNKDFPLHIALAYRTTAMKNDVYKCSSLIVYLQTCIRCFENLDEADIVTTLKGFINRGDFLVKSHVSTNPEVSVFWFLECAFTSLMESRTVPPYELYPTMLWITVCLKLRALWALKESVKQMWHSHFLKDAYKYELHHEAVKGLKKAITIGQELELPAELCFHMGCVYRLLVPNPSTVRPLQHSCNVVRALAQNFSSEDELVRFEKRLREHYVNALQSRRSGRFNSCSVPGTKLGAIQEGLQLLDAFLYVAGLKQWNVDEENKEWLQVLFILVDFNVQPEVFLEEFLSTRCVTTRLYYDFLTTKIVDETRKRLKDFTLTQFVPLYMSFAMPSELLENYLDVCRLGHHTLVDPTMEVFFEAVTQRLQCARMQRVLHRFLLRMATCYRSKGTGFIIDLLKLKAPLLFAVQIDKSGNKHEEDVTVVLGFQKDLENLICRNALKDALLSCFKEIVGHICEEHNSLQELVLPLLLKEVAPDSRELHCVPVKASIQFAVVTTVDILKGDLAWIKQPSAQHKFCLDFVTTCCRGITASNAHFDWIKDCEWTFFQICSIFQSYASQKSTDGECILADSLPKDVAQASYPCVLQYFEWVQGIHKILATWFAKLTKGDANYDDLHLYTECYEQIHRVAQAVSASGLVLPSEEVTSLQLTFLQNFEHVNISLLKYLPDDPKSKWCSLLSVLSEYNVRLPAELSDIVSQDILLPNDDNDKANRIKLLDHAPSPSTDGKFSPPSQEIYLCLSKSVSICMLQLLDQGLDDFLKPIEPHLNILVYFRLHTSIFFKTYVQHMHDVKKLIGTRAAVYRLGQAVCSTVELLTKIVKGTATYSEIVAGGSLDLNEVDVEKEFSLLARCPSIGPHGTAGLAGVKCLLKLTQFSNYIPTIEGVCQQYQLECCLKDPELMQLLEEAKLIANEQERDKLTLAVARKKWENVCRRLCLKEDSSMRSLDLFRAIANSRDFCHFLKEKQFTGRKGEVLFRQQFELITAHLQHEEYNEAVLNHLYAAFKFISPFMDSTLSFKKLMSTVATLDSAAGIHQLDTVNKNIHLIQLWFSRAEGDTNVSSELDSILQTGHYNFSPSTVSQNSSVTLELEFEPLLATKPNFLTQTSITSESEADQEEVAAVIDGELCEVTTEKWDVEKINDFIHKLGFLDPKQDEDKRVQSFIHLNEHAFKLLELFGKLKESGHPVYCNKEFEYRLECSTDLPNVMHVAEEEVSRTDQILVEWKEKLESLHSSYKWLLFFSVPKLISLYELLCDDEVSVPAVVDEVGFLFERTPKARENLQFAVKNATECCRKSTVDEDGFLFERTPNSGVFHQLAVRKQPSAMEVVGSFLAQLFSRQEILHSSLPQRCDQTYCKQSTSSTSIHLPTLSVQSKNVLHSAPNYSQSQLIRLILGIYGGPPEAFVVLQCWPTTTEQELKLFMKRVIQHPRKYLMLEVNNLPYHLQEIVLQQYIGHDTGTLHTSIHFIETAPSVLREVPWLTFNEYKERNPFSLDFTKVQALCQAVGLNKEEDLSCLELVHGLPGNGKTHYIMEKLGIVPKSHQVTIAVNEAFNWIKTIEKLRYLPCDEKHCAIFFNFTILPPVDSSQEKERKEYKRLMIEVGWFFFHLLMLGYVEDSITGTSFQLPGGQSWEVYVEVPSRDANEHKALEMFLEDVPVLGLLGTPKPIDPSREYCIDDRVQMICKYLKAYDDETIDDFYNEFTGKLVKFSKEPEIPKEECKRLLAKHMPDQSKRNKIAYKLFIHYMNRRCTFLDNCPAFNYNRGVGEYVGVSKRTDTRRLGSTIMKAMLKEVSDFCDPAIKENWSQIPHQQLIYDFKDGGGSFGLISLLPDVIPEEEKAKFMTIGVAIPSVEDIYSRKVLDGYLSRALNIPLKKGRLIPVDERDYVLTLDYTLKMLNIHERYECGIPVIIEGETGVGKTALIEMLSHLWNHSWVTQWDQAKDRIVDLMKRKLGDLPSDAVDTSKYELCIEAVRELSVGSLVPEDTFDIVGQLPDREAPFYMVLNQSLIKLERDPIFSMLDLQLKKGEKLFDVFQAIKLGSSSKDTARLLHILFSAKVKTTFHKLNVHAALQPKDIHAFFNPVFDQAHQLHDAYDACDPTKRPSFRVPFVTAYLDEINTASCLGLFKEIITDRSIDGKPIPENIFIIAACNPHRGNSLAAHESSESWLKGTYYVRNLHPTLQFLMWDYGSLNTIQEMEFVHAKMTMLNQQMANVDVASLSDPIVKSQKIMREYAFEQLQSKNIPRKEAQLCAKSSVSQRDIQRVFTFYQWLRKLYAKFSPHSEQDHHRAVLVALGIVYYMRLSSKYRGKYRLFLENLPSLVGEVLFSQAYNDQLNWFIDLVELPPGIAKTIALKENIFATIACTETNTPLIIVGHPGSSKTLSFNIALANLKGPESGVKQFRETDIFYSLDPHFYQCSRRTTSNEVEKIFQRAITRQRTLQEIPLPVYCVVFMDEAGLPENRLESLKVLHYHLDKHEVSFVAISNHTLDAAKTNRAVSLFRPKALQSELDELAQGCITPVDQTLSEEEKKMVTSFCSSYNFILEDDKFPNRFGLRDFIHFILYLRRKRQHVLDTQLLLESLERNFNGCPAKLFRGLCQVFFERLPPKLVRSPIEKLHSRSILEILKSSLEDCPSLTSEADDIHNSIQCEVRYKLIIDPSEDDSLVRLLFAHGVLQREHTRLYICSDFSGDSQRVNTIAQIRHSISAGHTILMCQTDEIHESFYDLFNQRFRAIRSIEDPHHPQLYAHIAIGTHSKPCRVNPEFQCIVVIKESEVKNTPAPFLNRFEKYYLSHEDLLDTVLHSLPPCLKLLVMAAQAKVNEFICMVDPSNLYGYKEETLNSLMLSILPATGHKYKPLENHHSGIAENMDVKVLLLKTLVDGLGQNAGFHIPMCSIEELKADAERIFGLVLQEPQFERLMEDIEHDNPANVVDEALCVLFRQTNPQNQDSVVQIYSDTCLVISVLLHWLVCYLCKRLMQLMTPEALLIHSKKIPHPYLQSYLQFQEHFSLKQLVEKHFMNLRRNSRKVTFCPTKLLCFTRSSAVIHKLPAQFPCTVASESTKYYESLREHIFPCMEHLMICKVSSRHSQGKLEKLLDKFVNSDARLLLFIANMQELSKKIINHLRIMIEEAESKAESRDKLFVILLHFPPVMFFAPQCYPSLFLQGWDLYYLDSIMQCTLSREGTESLPLVDIQNWFQRCCFGDSLVDFPFQQKHMLSRLQDLLHEAIPIIASRVTFTSKESEFLKFSRPMNASQRSETLRKSFFEKGVGKVLTARFCAYWTPQLTRKYMEKVARFTSSQESTLNITDSIQTIVRSSFFDFLVFILNKINLDFNIDILFEETCPAVVQQLFLELLEELPVPKFGQLRILSANVRPQHIQREDICLPQFPFFKQVCEMLERAIEESTQEVNQRTDILQNNENGANVTASLRQIQKRSKQKMEETYTDVVTSKVRENWKNTQESQESEPHPELELVQHHADDVGPKIRTDCLKVTVEAMNRDHTKQIWKRYFTDFAHHKLHVQSRPSELTKQILEVYIGPLNGEDALAQIVALHVRLHVRQIDLTKIAGTLRPITKMQEEAEQTLSPRAGSSTWIPTLSSLLVPPEPGPESIQMMATSLAAFVVNTLFHYIYQVDEISDTTSFNSWYNSYHNIISMPALEKDIMGNIYPETETQLNILHATYLVIQCCAESSSVRGQQIFRTLYSRYFGQGSEKSVNAPHMKEIATTGLDTMAAAPPDLHMDFDTMAAVTSDLDINFDTKVAATPDLDTDFDAMAAASPDLDTDFDTMADYNTMEAAPSSPSRSDYCLRRFVEGLFAFFFSQHRVFFSEEDCIWFLEIANQQQNFCPSNTRIGATTEESNPFLNCTSMNIFKFYLSRILDESAQKRDPKNVTSGRATGDSDFQPLQLYSSPRREMVGKVLINHGSIKTPGPYVPTFYQFVKSLHISPCEASQNSLMQQPLAHLYFQMVLEHLNSRKGQQLVFLIKSADKITKMCTSKSTPDYVKVLLYIEKQAIIQTILKQLSSFFDPKDPQKMHELFSSRIASDINSLLDDVSMGGGGTQHGLVLALHLQRRLNSSRKLVSMLRDGQSSLVRSIHCVKPLQSLTEIQPKSETHLFPFIGPDEKSSELGYFYQEIFETMARVHNTCASQESIDQLVILAEASCSSEDKMKISINPDSPSISRRAAFRMLCWLCAYYKFFAKQNHSKYVADVLGNNLKDIEYLEPEFIGLLQSFIYPKHYMIKNPEPPLVLNENAEVLEERVDAQGFIDFVPKIYEGEMKDPIFELFNPPSNSKQDQTDSELCQALANMVAIAVSCPPESNHLWYHMFAADALLNSYLTGFMYNGVVNKGRLYDCGVEFAADGTYGRPDYIPHATRGTLSLHSLYLLLWANFGAFCMALLTQPDAQEKINGQRHGVISDWQPIRHYCISQLRKMWLFIGSNLKLSLEEQSFFIMSCMYKMLELSVNGPPALHGGRFENLEELDAYERMWHNNIFIPSYTGLHEKFADYCQLWKNVLLRDLSFLDTHYPHYPTMEEFCQTLLSSSNVSDAAQNPLYVLSQFALEYPRLHAAGALLPDLIEFYRWLHNDLAYLVTLEEAQNRTVEDVMTVAGNKYAGVDLNQLYERVKDGYNKYVEVIGHSIGAGACANVRREGKIYFIADNTKLLHLLSEAEEEGESNDWLFIVIKDIVEFHNAFLGKIFQALDTPQHSSLKQHFPEQQLEHVYVYPTEVNDHTCIVGKPESLHGISEHLQLVRSRYLQPVDDVPYDATKACTFDFEQLQEDVIKTFLVGKPLIRDPSKHLRNQFKFKKQMKDTTGLDISDIDISVLSEYVAQDSGFREQLEDEYVKRLECEFHIADIHVLVTVARGLRTATEHLIKSLYLKDDPTVTSANLKDMTVPKFLLTVYKQKKEEHEMMADVGIQGLYATQLSCLLTLKLPYLYCTLEQFVWWIKDGMYDFHQLPLVMKKHLEPEDVGALSQLRGQYQGSMSDLLKELQDLTKALVHSESHLRNTIAENVQKPMMLFLKDLQLYGDSEALAELIPETVVCQHYVALRVMLRRQASIIQNEMSGTSLHTVADLEDKWSELVEDLWGENKLKCLWDAAVPYQYEQPFQYDPHTGLYGFQEGYDPEEEEEFAFIPTEDPREQVEHGHPPKLTTGPPHTDSHVEPSDNQQPSIQTSEEQLRAIAKKLKVPEVAQYLESLKLKEYCSLFTENDVDGELLWQLSQTELEALGVTNPFHRRKILGKFHTYLETIL